MADISVNTNLKYKYLLLKSLTFLLDGHLFSWGQNTWSQLGHSPGVASVPTPVKIYLLEALPVAQIAAGQRHSFVLSVSGAVFGWGKNK